MAKRKNENENECESEVKKLKLKLRKTIDNEGKPKWELIKHFINPGLSVQMQDQIGKVYEEVVSDEKRPEVDHEKYGDEEAAACGRSKEERAAEFDKLLQELEEAENEYDKINQEAKKEFTELFLIYI